MFSQISAVFVFCFLFFPGIRRLSTDRFQLPAPSETALESMSCLSQSPAIGSVTYIQWWIVSKVSKLIQFSPIQDISDQQSQPRYPRDTEGCSAHPYFFPLFEVLTPSPSVIKVCFSRNPICNALLCYQLNIFSYTSHYIKMHLVLSSLLTMPHYGLYHLYTMSKTYLLMEITFSSTVPFKYTLHTTRQQSL